MSLEELYELYNYWFSNEKVWFTPTNDDDILITTKYENLLLNYSTIIPEFNDKKLMISIILLYDQISRHVRRVKNYDITKELNVKILDYIRKNNFEDVNVTEFCFVMLPFRHSKDMDNIKYVLNKSWIRLLESNLELDQNQLKRFIKATYENSLKHLQDIKFIEHQSNELLNIEQITEKFKPILDVLVFQFHDITKSTFIEKELKFLNKTKKYILSLSGGVDSIVLSYLLTIKNYDFVCVFINYTNRDCNLLEEEFLCNWCKFIKKTLYITRIDEINREKCMNYDLREIYESYTRQIRYKSYETAAKINNFENVNIIMGHNKDDCFENVVTNITDRCKYENLKGMESISIINNLTFYRPILNVPKSEIYNTAFKYKIPFLYDSTVKWCRRGKIRDNIVPVLNEFDNECINGFHNLSEMMSELYEINKMYVNNYIEKLKSYDDKIKSLEKYENMKYMDVKFDEFMNTKIFWKTFFNTLKIYPSQNSINELVDRISRFKSTYDNIFINEIEKQHICKNCDVIFYKLKDESINLIIHHL